MKARVHDRLSAANRALLLADPSLRGRFGATLSEWSDEAVARSLARLLGIPFVDLQPEHVDEKLFDTYRLDCLGLRFLPLFRHGILFCVAVEEPFNESVLRRLRSRFHQELRPIGVTTRAFDRAFAHLHARPLPPPPSEDPPPPMVSHWDVNPMDYLTSAQSILRHAVLSRASDVLFESMPHWLDIRYKTYGRCEVMPPIEPRHARGLLDAVKVMARISPQDTRPFISANADLQVGQRTVNFRVESVKSIYGPAITYRVLDNSFLNTQNPVLPFKAKHRESIQSCLSRGQGIFLVTGPTGSGKSTTLMRCVAAMDLSSRNVRTLEDPVEFKGDRLVQIPAPMKQVGADENDRRPDFSGGLRSLLRQAPDVIYLGEIRDEDTAAVATQAALTGHLILSTAHTLDSVNAVTRFLDLKVSPMIIRSTFMAVIAQRLVPRLCTCCRQPVEPDPLLVRHFKMHGKADKVPALAYHRGGCRECAGTGIKGREAVQEIMYLDETLRDLITPGFSESALRAKWIERGGEPLVAQGLDLVADGLVEHSEILALEMSPIP